MEKKETKIFKKEDFLNTRQLAAKLGEDFDFIRDSMKNIFKCGTKIIVNNHKTPMVTHLNNSTTYRLHPCAIEEFIAKRKVHS